MAVKFDIVNLCELVEANPCLWDKRHDDYKNKIERERAWDNIARFLDEEYESKSSQEKKEAGDKIVVKWVNIRDAFIRSLKGKSGQAAKKKYIYSDHLQFLLAIQEPSPTDSSRLVDDEQVEGGSGEVVDSPPETFLSSNETSSRPSSSQLPKEKLGRKRSSQALLDVEREILKELKSPREEQCSFFTSFEQYVTDMSEAEKMELHLNMLQSIMSIKARRTSTVFVEENSLDI